MKIKSKILLLLTTVACFATLLGAGITVKNNNFLAVSAATQTKTIDEVTLLMDEGAAVRKDTPTGLRYRSLLSVEDYNALEANKETYQRITYGMLIAPTDYLVEYGALNAETVFGENPIYSWTDDADVAHGGDVEIINVSRNQMTDYVDENGNSWKNFMGVIYNLKGTN